MLNPPLSLLSEDILYYIVDHVARLPYSNLALRNLSITDRAFTQFCQAQIFKDLYLGYDDRKTRYLIDKKLAKIRNILNDEPSIANRVRTVHIALIPKGLSRVKRNNWLFNDPNFITIIQLLAKSLMPPHKLHFIGYARSYTIIEDPIFFVGWLTQTFFSQTLTVLDITKCRNVPLTLFLICPSLREVYLDDVKASESRDDEYPATQRSGRRKLPALERLNYRNSGSLVKKMITPPSKFSMAVVNWSKLRVLKLCPEEKEGMVYLQPILDAACNTLEELYLTNKQVTLCLDEQLSLAGLVDLRHLPNLHIFAIHSLIRSDAREPVVLHDIIRVLSTIPKANQITKLSLDFTIYCEHPFVKCLEEDWVGMCDEIVRVSAGKPLELDSEMSISSVYPPLGQDELYERIKEKIASLSDYPNICTYFWHPRSEMIPYPVTLNPVASYNVLGITLQD